MNHVSPALCGPEFIRHMGGLVAAFNDVRDLATLARQAATLLAPLIDADFGGFYLLDPADQRLRLYYAQGLTDDEQQAAERAAPERYPGLVVRSGQPLHLHDIAPGDPAAGWPSARRGAVRARLFVPVFAGKRCVGTFGFSSARMAAFSEEHVALLDFVAQLAGLAYGAILAAAERETSERALHERNRQVRHMARLVSHSPDLMGVLDAPSGRFVEVNPAFEAFLGVAGDAVTAQPFDAYLRPEDRQRFAEFLLPPSEADVPVRSLEVKMKNAAGEPRWLDWKGTYAAGRWFLNARDITLLRRTAQDLRLAQFAIDRAGEAVLFITADGRVERINPAGCALFGCEGGHQLASPAIYDLVPELTPERWTQTFERLRNAGTLLHEIDCRTADGSVRRAEVSSNLVAYHGREYDCAFFRDITERKAMDERIRRLSFVATHTKSGVVITDAARRIEWVNDGFTRITGYTLDEVKGRSPGSFLQGPDTDPETVEYMRSRLRDGKGFQVELLNHGKDGAVRWLSVEVQPIGDAEGNITNFVGIETDVTARRRAEEELREVRLRELEIGARIQRTLLRGQPPRTLLGATVAALSVPSQYVDGDFSDYSVQDGSLDILVGDVMGKGVPAALLGAATKNHFLRAKTQVLTSQLVTRGPGPATVMNFAHRSLTPEFMQLDSFATVCSARFDLARHEVAYVSAGHTRTLHFDRRQGEVRFLSGDNLPLGIVEDERYEETTRAFGPGDVFVFYSDGLTEARGPTGEFFGEERLAELLRECATLAPARLVECVERAVRTFTEGTDLKDDLTLIVVRIEDEYGDAEARDTLHTTSALGELATVRRFLRAQLAAAPHAGLSEDDVARLELAVNEAASNIMKHGYAGRPDRRLSVTVTRYPHDWIVELGHEGSALHRDRVGPPLFDGSRESGFGLYLIDQCVDVVHYLTEPGGRHVTRLVKRRDMSIGEP